jgi:hypothetical protein
MNMSTVDPVVPPFFSPALSPWRRMDRHGKHSGYADQETLGNRIDTLQQTGGATYD